jgi:DNA-binding NtrC family response regulator
MSARILVVDDEANIRALIEEILSEEGYDVTTAADAKEARSARKRHEFDLILLDIWMPDTDGISLLREWSEGAAPGSVVMMSGHGTVDTAVEATRLGAIDFIEKPVSLAKLLRTVERALSVRRSKEQRRGAAAHDSVPAGKSQPIRALREQTARVAQHNAHTLFTGESGSGRELFARFLASQSALARAPFVAVMGGDLTDENAQRELLGEGTEMGAFERAEGGILFIQELGEVGPQAFSTSALPPTAKNSYWPINKL